MYDQRIISTADYEGYIESKPNNKVELMWASIVSQLPSEMLKREARKRRFTLVPHDIILEDGISKTFAMTVPNGSRRLLNQFDNLDNIISLIKD